MSISRGTRLGPYEIQSVLGAGGMGEVYGAMDTRLGRRVAIKVLPAARAADPERRRRFEQEARAVSALNHPHICTLFDIGSSAPGPGAEPPVEYLVMEWVDGETLAQRIGRGALPVGDVLRYGAQMADALAAAHSAGIVHRDLKPANVMLTKAGAKLLDFGLAKLLPAAAVGPGNLTTMAPAASPVTADGVVLGTVPYMAPEQVEGKEADARSDLFALGAVLYEMATGRRAFEGKSAASVMAAVLERDPPPLSTSAPLAPPALERLVRKCLAKDPSARWQTAADLADELRWISSDDHVSASHGAPGGAGARRRPNLGVAALAVGVLAIASVAAVAVWLRSRESPAPQAESVVAPPRVTPFMTSDSVERQPAWSPAGNLIAYVSDKAGNNDIWICDPAGANPINLTANSPGDDAFPAWSPDGQQLAFYSERDGGGIFTMGALGAGVRKVTSVKPSVLYTFGLQWASDSSLVHTNFDADGRKQVYRVPSRGGDPSCLTCGLAGIAGGQSGQLSASGKLLAFTSIQIGPRSTLYVLDFATRQVHTLETLASAPRWADGDRLLIFASSREGTPDLWQIPVDRSSGKPGGNAARITSGLGSSEFTVSADGRQIIAVLEKSTSNLWRFPTQLGAVPDRSAGRRITTGPFSDARGRWSPDGREIVFESNRRGGLNVWLVSAEGGEPTRVTSGVGLEFRPRFSPDGRWLAFDAPGRDGSYAHVMRRDGSDMRILDPSWPARNATTCCAAWSPDSRTLLVWERPRKASAGEISSVVELRIDPQTGSAR